MLPLKNLGKKLQVYKCKLDRSPGKANPTSLSKTATFLNCSKKLPLPMLMGMASFDF